MLLKKVLYSLGFVAAIVPSLAANAWGTQTSGAWQTVGSMSAPIADLSLVNVANGKTLAVGSMATQIFDPATNVWSKGATTLGIMPFPTVVALSDGRVLVTGGMGTSKIAKIFDPSLNKWTSTGSMKVGRYQHTATLLQDGRVLVAGGASGSNATSAEIFSPSTGTWTLTAPMSYARPAGHSATLFANGQVLIAGGTGTAVNPAEIFNPQSGTWTATGPMTAARGGHTASLLANGRVLVAGGCGGLSYTTTISGYGVNMSLYCRSTEIYNPATSIWQSAQSMNLPRSAFTATALANGKVLIAGGVTSCANVSISIVPVFKSCIATNSTETYDPSSDTWTFVNAMSVARYNHKATALPDGRVLVVGGTGNGTASAPLTSATAYTN